MDDLTKDENNDPGFQGQMIDECVAMVRYAMANGSNIPGDTVETLEKFTSPKPGPAKPVDGIALPDIRQLNGIHNRLARIVSPAIPRAILLMEDGDHKTGFFRFLGKIPFIRRMMVASMICLGLFVTISISPLINEKVIDVFKMSGLTLLLNELFLLTAAGLGASFHALFKANHYIVKGIYDPKYETSYWIRFVLGILAGLLLATLVPIGEHAVDSAATGQKGFEKPLLAMLGGFSANVVYQIFSRIITGVASMVKGDDQELTEVKVQGVKNQANEDLAKERFKLAADLIKLQDKLNSGAKTDELKKQVSDLMKKLTGEYDDGAG